MIKIISILLINVILFFNNGINYSIDYCCDVISKINISFSENHNESEKDCCACVSKKQQSCCSTSKVETVINQSLINKNIEKLSFDSPITYLKNKVNPLNFSNVITLDNSFSSINFFKFHNSIRLLKQVFNI